MNQILYTSRGQVEYRIAGSKENIVLVLNGGHSSRSSSPVPFGLQLLKQGFGLLIPSRPGYGNTPSSTGVTTQAFADCLVELLDDLQVKKVVVLGISAGARTALQLASKYPERVKKLVLISAVTHDQWPNGHDQWPNGWVRWLSYVLFHPLLESYVWMFLRWILGKFPLGSLRVIMRSFTTLPVNQVLKQMNTREIAEMIHYLSCLRSEAGFIHDLTHRTGDVSRIIAPTLIVHSRYDPSVPISHAQFATKMISKSTLMLTEAESHLLWLSKDRSQIADKIIDFLN